MSEAEKKTRLTCGADQKTPSVPQYFSWINNTNEGSTEAQTLLNLAFFRYMKEKYGMQLGIYAWDAGNFDGSQEGYGNVDSEKFRRQYPEGYAKVVRAAEEIGADLGLWGSPDGFGDDEKTEKARFDFFVHLCRDYHFGLFKLDGVCGQLRPEKAELFRQMLIECRKYKPELIVLNHRLNLYEAMPYVTTYLFNGRETYTDVLITNEMTAMHNRAYMFHRGHTENLDRLVEDHGVCLSSELDYFEDELIYQAFNRCLILAPEIYGNPWLLKDEELPRLARIYNLHRQVREILVDGMLLPEVYGPNACARGSETHRFISTGNSTWEDRLIPVRLDDEIGLKYTGKVRLVLRHPYEQDLGLYETGETVSIPALSFRSLLLEIAPEEECLPVLTNCEYRVITENGQGEPTQVQLIRCAGGPVMLLSHGKESLFDTVSPMDIKEKSPVPLGPVKRVEKADEDTEFYYETAMFAVNNDALEKRCLDRAGASAVPEVNACRKAFFEQANYVLRGCENAAMFDGRSDTFFDAKSRYYQGGQRDRGGCLRVDFGDVLEADTVEIECFSTLEPCHEVPPQVLPVQVETSRDLHGFQPSGPVTVRVKEACIEQTVTRMTKDTLFVNKGQRVVLSYSVQEAIRYLRVYCPPDRIYAVRALRNGTELPLHRPHGNNMQAHPCARMPKYTVSAEFALPADAAAKRIAVAANGVHGTEEITVCLKVNGTWIGCSHRAPDFRANMWEHRSTVTDHDNTFFFDLPETITDPTCEVRCTLSDRRSLEIRAYLCDRHH